MKRLYRTICLIALFAALTVSCRQLYTTSFGSSLARDGLSISSNTSISDLLDIANSSDGASPEAAKELLDVFAGKSATDIQALSVDDKTTILNLASTAAIDFGTINDTFSGYDAATSDSNALIEAALGAFDTSVDLTAIELLLTEIEANPAIDSIDIPIDTIVFASAVVIADLASELGTAEVMGYLGGDSIAALTPEQQTTITMLKNLALDLETRPDVGDAELGGFNLIDLLAGTP